MKKEELIKSLFISHNKVVLYFLILSFIFDFVHKIELFYGIDFINYGKFLKIFFLLYASLFLVLKTEREKYHRLYIVIIGLTILFFLKGNLSNTYLLEFSRYLFPLLTFPLLHIYLIKKKELLNRLYLIFKILVFLNLTLIIVGVLLEAKIVKTYDSDRFGFNGIILSQGFLPYIYLCATMIFWSYRDRLMLGVIIFLSIISGVKGVYFSQFLLFSLLVITDNEYNKFLKIKILTSIVLVFWFLIIWILSSDLFKNIYKEQGFLDAIFSQRIYYTKELFGELNMDNFNFFIGAISLIKIRLELQIVDVFLFFGFIGLIIYIYFFFLLFKYFAIERKSRVFFITVVTLSLLAGNLLYIPLALILVFLILIALKEDNKLFG